MSAVWAVYLYPIIRRGDEPVPTLATGSYEDCEAAYFAALENPEIDDFYLELVELPGPFDG